MRRDARWWGGHGYRDAHARRGDVSDGAARAACPGGVDTAEYVAGWRATREADELEVLRFAPRPLAFVPLAIAALG